MAALRNLVIGHTLILILLSAGSLGAETETPADPAREMLLAHYQSVKSSYHQLFNTVPLPPNLGLPRAELQDSLSRMQEALSHWKIEFHPGYAAFAVQTAVHLLVINPQSMQAIVEEDDDVLLHESVHLSSSQVRRQLYGLHSELVFFEWLQDHLDEEKASQAEGQMNHMLSPDDILRLKLWSTIAPAPLHALEETFRVSWICEIQAYYVQMLAFDRELKKQGAPSLKNTAEMLRKTLVSETGLPSIEGDAQAPSGLVGEADMALTLFQSFSPQQVSEGFQEAVLSCVVMDVHKGALFKTLAEASGWDLNKAKKDAAYRHRLLAWARTKILKWNQIKADRMDLNPAEIQELQQNGLIAPGTYNP